jgi:hypothetical protein
MCKMIDIHIPAEKHTYSFSVYQTQTEHNFSGRKAGRVLLVNKSVQPSPQKKAAQLPGQI